MLMVVEAIQAGGESFLLMCFYSPSSLLVLGGKVGEGPIWGHRAWCEREGMARDRGES